MKFKPDDSVSSGLFLYFSCTIRLKWMLFCHKIHGNDEKQELVNKNQKNRIKMHKTY